MEWAIAGAGKILRVQQVAGCRQGAAVREGGREGGRKGGTERGSRSNGHSGERGSTWLRNREGRREGGGRIALLQESFKRYLSVEASKDERKADFSF